MDRRPDVADEVLHAVRGVSLLEALLDGVAIARRARAAEGQQSQAQPLLEEGLLDLVVMPGLALLDDDLLAEALMPRLLLDDLLHHVAIRHERALLVVAELPESAAVEEELGHGQPDPALGEGPRLARQPLAHLGLDLLAREPAVHLGDGVVVLGFLADVPDHELHPLVRHEAQAVGEHVRGGQLAVGLALHELDEHRASLFGHVVNEGHFAGHRPPLDGDGPSLGSRVARYASLALLQDVARDDELLDLAGALVDPQRAHLPVQPFDGGAPHHALAGVPSKRPSPSGCGAIGSRGFTAIPGASASTRNIDRPRCSPPSPVRARTVYIPAMPAFEMNVFTPRKRHTGPSAVARVRTPARSE